MSCIEFINQAKEYQKSYLLLKLYPLTNYPCFEVAKYLRVDIWEMGHGSTNWGNYHSHGLLLCCNITNHESSIVSTTPLEFHITVYALNTFNIKWCFAICFSKLGNAPQHWKSLPGQDRKQGHNLLFTKIWLNIKMDAMLSVKSYCVNSALRKFGGKGQDLKEINSHILHLINLC